MSDTNCAKALRERLPSQQLLQRQYEQHVGRRSRRSRAGDYRQPACAVLGREIPQLHVDIKLAVDVDVVASRI
jgi:hypothetical protein